MSTTSRSRLYCPRCRFANPTDKVNCLACGEPLPSLSASLKVQDKLPGGAGTNSNALFSLLLGIAGVFLCAPLAFGAIYYGHKARAEIRQSEGAEGGSVMAIIGLGLGYLMSAALALAILATIVLVVLLLLTPGGARR